MKNGIRFAGLLVFWISIFAAVTYVIRWKQGADMKGQLQSQLEDGEKTEEQTQQELVEEALGEGRALFTIPEPVSYDELTLLLQDLEATKSEYDQKLAGLAEKERSLEIQQSELNQRQSELITMAENITPNQETSNKKPPRFEVDPAGLKKIVKNFEQMKSPELVADALLAMTAEQQVLILMELSEKTSAEVLKSFPEEDLERTIELMMQKKSTPEDDN